MNITIKCQDCGRDFIFYENEQKFYEEKHLSQPKRCRICRQNKKERRNSYGR